VESGHLISRNTLNPGKQTVKTIDFVYYGAAAAGNPLAGPLYAQLLHDATIGYPFRSTDELALILGVGTKQAGRLLDTLVEWGVVQKRGYGRARKLVVGMPPNLAFCRAVLEGVYGEGYAQIINPPGTDTQPETFGVLFVPNEGPPVLVANAAVAVLVSLFSGKEYRHLLMPAPGGQDGYVVWQGLTPLLGGHEPGQMLNMYISSAYRVVSTDHQVQIEQMSVLVSDDPANVVYAHYPTTLPAGIVVPPPNKTRRARASTAASGKRCQKLPDSSKGFLYWPAEKLELDTGHYPQVVRLVEHFNETFETENRLNWKLYVPIRECLVEEGFVVEDLERAITQARHDPWWRDKMNVYKLFNNPHIIRELLGKARNDRLARGFDPQPRGEAVEFTF
jgi:hypothetical protein